MSAAAAMGSNHNFFNGAAQNGAGQQQQWSRGGGQQNGFNGYQQQEQNGGYQNGAANGAPAPAAVPQQGDWNAQSLGNDQMEKNLFSQANSGINFDKYEEIPVNVTGDDAPTPIDAFSEAAFHPWIHENINRSGYTKPTPVQKHSIPSLLANRDLMSCAQTGSGKTAAFLLPIINHILVAGPQGLMQPQMSPQGRRMYFPSALVLSPTRELAIQIHKEAAKFSYRTNIVTAILYGGRENYRDQINKLRGGCHILIATPGRLIDIIEQGYIGLAGCRYLVLDEADRMLDMGFEPQIRRIVGNGMPPKTHRVTAMFSATFPSEIQKLAGDFLKPDYLFLAVGRVGSTSENITQHVEWVDEHDKRRALLQKLDQIDQGALALVFVETKRGASELAFYLQRNNNTRAVAIHGDLKQFERERNLDMFRSGQNPVLVATAVAARGLDIPNVRLVLNYDLPNDVDEYVHRIGRTGRCGNTGIAISFFNDKNRALARDMLSNLKEAGQEIPEFLQKVAAEGGRGTGRGGGGRGGRFGATDHRRGGFNQGARGGGFGGGQRMGYGGQQGGFGGGAQGSFSNTGSAGFGGRPQFGGGFQPQQQHGYGGFNAQQPRRGGFNSGFQNGGGYQQQAQGGFGGASGFGGGQQWNGGMQQRRPMAFNGAAAATGGFQNYSQPPPAQSQTSFGAAPPQQSGFGNWQR